MHFRYSINLFLMALIAIIFCVVGCNNDDGGGHPSGPANEPPSTPSNPTPDDEETGVELSPTLRWECSDPDDDDLTYQVFFGEDSTPDNGEYQEDVLGDSWSVEDNLGSLDPETTYFWKIVADDGYDHEVEGPVWSFTTAGPGNQPPSEPSNPNPADASEDVSADATLSWSCSDPDGDELTYDVYFGTDSSPDSSELVEPDHSIASYDPGALNLITTYYWKIVAKDDQGNSTSGPVWSFTTGDGEISLVEVGAVDFGQFGFATFCVAVAGNYAYVGSGGALRVVDVSNPSSPVHVGTEWTPGSAQGVAVAGNYVYVADGNDGLCVIDVSNPSSPVEVGAVDTPGYAEGVAVVGNYAYIGGSWGDLRVIDVSTPSSPVHVGTVDTDGAFDVAVAGNYAYVTCVHGLQLLDVSSPSSPVEAGAADTPLSGHTVAVAGNYAYLTCGVATLSSALWVIDVSNPSFPVEVGNVDIPGYYGYEVAVAGNYAYVAVGNDGLRMIDVSSPSSPVEVGAVDTLGDAEGVAVAGNYAYVADYSSGLRIIQIGQ